MKAKRALFAALLVALAAVGSARADDLRAVMEADNARWLAAYNTNTPAAFPAMYTKDAVVLPPGAQPVDGREAIGKLLGGAPQARKPEGPHVRDRQNWAGRPPRVSGSALDARHHQQDRRADEAVGKYRPYFRATGRRHLAHQGAHLQSAAVIAGRRILRAAAVAQHFALIGHASQSLQGAEAQHASLTQAATRPRRRAPRGTPAALQRFVGNLLECPTVGVKRPRANSRCRTEF